MNVFPSQSRRPATDEIFLEANDRAYTRLVDTLQRMDGREAPDAVLEQVALAALVASEFHTGRFADGAIENVAFEIGAALDGRDGGDLLQAGEPIRTKKRRVLHVATQVGAIGGHSRMLAHWVRKDRSSLHSLAIVDQGQAAIPGWLSDAVHDSGGQVVSFPAMSRCSKARQLRRLARAHADLVVLHHYPFDVIPTVTFATAECPPVAVFNHADHQFWLGSSVSDLAICFRSIAAEHTSHHRSVRDTTVLPIPLMDPAGQPAMEDARQVLGVPLDQIVLLTVGRAEKYRPAAVYDFVGTVGKILDRHPKVHLYVVGETLTGLAPYLRSQVHERLHLLGAIEEPSVWRAAADLYLESFPFGSHTALLEAALSGLAVVPAYAPLSPLIVAADDSLRDLISNLRSEDEYIDASDQLIRYPQRRQELGKSLQERLRIDHVGDGWLRRLAAVYEKTDRAAHEPRPIPSSQCCMARSDVALSLWHARADGENWTSDTLGDGRGAMLRHSAFVARTTGDYAGAVRFAVRAVCRDPGKTSWRVLAIAVLGNAAGGWVRRIRRYLRSVVALAQGEAR